MAILTAVAMNVPTAIQTQADELVGCCGPPARRAWPESRSAALSRRVTSPELKQMQFHAAAQQADHPLGPTLIAMGGAHGPGKSHASIEQAAVDDC